MAEDNAGLFTPRHVRTDERLRMFLTPASWERKAQAERAAGRGGQWSCKVVDRETGQAYIAWDADCGAGCRCDALVIEVPN